VSDWLVDHLTGGTSALLQRDALHAPRRRVTLLELDRPALVLGSTQRDSIVDASAARSSGIDIGRRRTGGGAVFLDPNDSLWVDIVIPRDDVLWRDDIAHAFGWLGTAWADALVALGVREPGVNEAAACHSVLGRLICFAGLGFGEVSSPAGKIVGLSQRRGRDGAWFQCAVLRRWDTEPYRSLLAPSLAVVSAGAGGAEGVDAALAGIRVQPVPFDDRELVEALVAHLPP
jgi:lipoate-protein ligase A